ncbi:HAD hydrolase family protein [Agathobaculum sp.]|uniref:HAD hydrolase family protein n=1 Tax=Agathobaculum sp. TaxID=2048138 RepID=UPI0035209A72
MRRKYFFFDIDGTLSTGLTTTMPESAVKCLDLLRQAGHFTAIATGRLQASAKTVADRYGFTNIVADGGWSVTSDRNYLSLAPENYFPVLWDPRYDHHVLDHLYKVYFRCPIGEEEQMQSGELPLVRYNPEIVFVEPKEKQRGIRKVQELYHIPDEDIVVFGDGMNDLCMFGQGWLSIAMGNARDALKAKADYITTDVDKDGLWNACKHFGWI